MSKKTNLLPRREGESLTDWTLRFLADAQKKIRVAQEDQVDLDRRRMNDLYHATTPREAEIDE